MAPAEKIYLYIKRRARHSESIESVHERYMSGIRDLPPPLGFSGQSTPPAPTCGKELIASINGKIPEQRGITLFGHYLYRGENYEYIDRGSFDDSVSYLFLSSNKFVDFKKLLHDQLPQAIVAFGAYTAFVTYGMHDYYFAESSSRYAQLRMDPAIDINGRNNIFTLYQAQFWDDEKCDRALGFGAEEVVRRLKGKAPFVKLLANGVYLVLNDDIKFSYEQFTEINAQFKFLLGL